MGSINDMLARLSVTGTQGEKFPYSQHMYSGRLTIRSILGREDGGLGLAGQTLTVGGYVSVNNDSEKKLSLRLLLVFGDDLQNKNLDMHLSIF